MSKHTPGPWVAVTRTNAHIEIEAPSQPGYSAKKVATVSLTNHEANARLIAAAPTQHAEMLRYLPVLERAEADSELWARLTDGLGIATLNGYRAAIKKAEEGEQA